MEHGLELLTDAGRFLPVTVVAAIVLFVAKEGLEGFRRLKANSRKRRVIRRLIADEIERNHWTIKNLRSGLSKIDSYMNSENSTILIHVGAVGERYIRLENAGGRSQSPVGKVHTEALSANLLALADIDLAIFEEALEASDAIRELDHLLRSMVEHISNDEDQWLLESFSDYAKLKIAECEKTLRDFYKRITGRELEDHRVR